MYDPLIYVLVHMAIQLPMMFVLAASSLAPVFLIGDWHWAAFPMHMIVTAATLWAFESLAQTCSLFAHPVIGLLLFVNVWFTALLMNGFLLPATDIIWPFRILTYVLPLRWSIRENAYILLHDTPPYAGAASCNTPGVSWSIVPTCPASGFVCEPQVPPQICWGQKGSEILGSLAATYDVYDTNDVFGMAMGIICANAALLQLLHFLMLRASARGEASELPFAAHMDATPGLSALAVSDPKISGQDPETSQSVDGFGTSVRLSSGEL